MTIKHSKYKNTGILFELLVRQITADTLSGTESKAANILKKYFIFRAIHLYLTDNFSSFSLIHASHLNSCQVN